ncbi:Arrestin-C domain-containing protein [Mycena chlorophos]|uniref:Arrestin-C domain-containing protein n=1 Tax=Mycena chlorophos TaxID=658473 RepID=A0A8H6SV01_MYCCL|nr:Arrestin-C domain-containing protein [Mycena chlorophos]
MTFSLTRPSSPVNAHGPQIGSEGHSGDAAASTRIDVDSMKERPYLEIYLDNEFVCLKGRGNEVEPARLTGHVSLHLAESTPIKEITLQFRGKARLPAHPNESSLHHSANTYVICSHDWSFLEGERKHSHTLKAGRHFFPFQLQIGGSLPSSIASRVFGGASVAYKLRAQAVRPGLVHTNLQATLPVQILRSFSADALEYQQTLEIENTWPNKLMYSVMLPHKAWAATDTLTALVKFSPLVKGVGVLSIATTINEVTKLHSRNTVQETTRAVAHMNHDIIGGKAVEVGRFPWLRRSPPSTTNTLSTTPAASPEPAQGSSSADSYFALAPQPNAEEGSSSQQEEEQPQPEPEESLEQGQSDVVTFVTIPIPSTATPTHSLEPITVSHRIRWSILIINLDGHTSELRCSLPLFILDQRLLKEARAYTSPTRRLLLGGDEVPPEEEEELELPSYNAHVRDRIANMYLPEAATVRVTNPLMNPSPGNTPPASGLASALQTPARSGYATPLDPHLLSHLPHAPGSDDSTPLDWINSELLLSLQAGSPPADSHVVSSATSNSGSDHRDSRPSSTRPSRRASRAPSPERSHEPSATAVSIAGPNETYVHSSNASRNLHGLFSVSMKPFTAHPHWPGIGARSTSHPNMTSLTALNNNGASNVPRTRQEPDPSPASLQRAYTEVPDYDIAARGFIGGVPPLSSLQGLPSYEEAERVGSRSAPATPAC